MNGKLYLLADEVKISEDDYLEREFLVQEFKKLPAEFFSKLKYIQPQVGSLHKCKENNDPNYKVEFWVGRRIRNIIAALKYTSPKNVNSRPLIAYGNSKHKNGTVFPDFDNYVENYPYLDTFIQLAYNELGVTTKVSAVGYSRYNDVLNSMHNRINLMDNQALKGINISFVSHNADLDLVDDRYSRLDYILDMSNLLSIYKPYYYLYSTKCKSMCVELKYKPLIRLYDVYDSNIMGHKVICCGKYLLISKEQISCMQECTVSISSTQQLLYEGESTEFYLIRLNTLVLTHEHFMDVCNKFVTDNIVGPKVVDVYLVNNSDGIYYAINPNMTENGRYGMYIYPQNPMRQYSGYVIAESFFLNAIIKYKNSKKVKGFEKFRKATWEDVYRVLEVCRKSAISYKSLGDDERYQYILKEMLPIINIYAFSLQLAKYPASNFFDTDFSVDAEVIATSEEVTSEFKRLFNIQNKLSHVSQSSDIYCAESVDGDFCWSLSCGYDNTIIIEKFNSHPTGDTRNLVADKTVIQLSNLDKQYNSDSLKSVYIMPGEQLN